LKKTMKANENLRIIGTKVHLVPYCPKHVPKYHEWMQDVEIQTLTASEPLSLTEEYEMCDSWRQDSDKLTFILLDATLLGEKDEIGAMCGDINLFLNDTEDRTKGELELMIAEPKCRRKGIGEQALNLFIAYCAKEIGIRTFRVQIGEGNEASIGLFRKLGFGEVGRSKFFKEVHLELALEGEKLEQTLKDGEGLRQTLYDE